MAGFRREEEKRGNQLMGGKVERLNSFPLKKERGSRRRWQHDVLGSVCSASHPMNAGFRLMPVQIWVPESTGGCTGRCLPGYTSMA